MSIRCWSLSLLVAAAAATPVVAAGQAPAVPFAEELRQLFREVCPRAFAASGAVAAESFRAGDAFRQLVKRCAEEHRGAGTDRRADSLRAVLDSLRTSLALSRAMGEAGSGRGIPALDAGSSLTGTSRSAARAADSRTSRLLAQVLSAPIGKILVNTDTVMQAGVPSAMVVRIDQRVGEQIRQRLNTSGLTIVDTVRVTTVMSVDVHGPNFTVTRVPASAKPEQLVLPDQFTEWRFEVKPKSSGADTLFVLAAARFSVGATEEPRYYPVTTVPVRVRVNVPYATAEFMRNYWEWIVGTPMLPLFGWFARRRSAERRNLREGAGGAGRAERSPGRTTPRPAARRPPGGRGVPPATAQRQDEF